MNKNRLPVVSDGLTAYLQQVQAIPMLSAEEEYNLATRYQENGDLMAAQDLILSHLRYVARIAKNYSGYGLGIADLIQEGTIGLMKAVKRFDPKVGVRLASFAVHWIKSEINEYVIRNWRIVKIATTKSQRKLFFNLRQAKKRLGWFTTEEVKAVAEDLGVSCKDVLEMEKRLNAHDDSFNLEPIDEDHVQHVSPAHYLPAPTEWEPMQSTSNDNWEEKSQQALNQALTLLDSRSLDIISHRWLTDEKLPLKDLAEKYEVSIERIRQLEQNAIDKLRVAMEKSNLV